MSNYLQDFVASAIKRRSSETWRAGKHASHEKKNRPRVSIEAGKWKTEAEASEQAASHNEAVSMTATEELDQVSNSEGNWTGFVRLWVI